VEALARTRCDAARSASRFCLTRCSSSRRAATWASSPASSHCRGKAEHKPALGPRRAHLPIQLCSSLRSRSGRPPALALPPRWHTTMHAQPKPSTHMTV
jgi:hypothetical protein